MKHAVAMALAFTVLGSAVVARPSASLLSPAQADQGKDAPPADEAPLTRDQILKEGPAALEQHCTQCHLSDKWEGTSRDHAGWAASVREMARLMAEAGMPPMSERTTTIIVDYLTLTRPQ